MIFAFTIFLSAIAFILFGVKEIHDSNGTSLEGCWMVTVGSVFLLALILYAGVMELVIN